MFLKILTICICLGSLCGAENESAINPDSQLPLIFKERQNEMVLSQWEFRSESLEENRSSSSLSTRLSEGRYPAFFVDTHVSLSGPNRSLSVAIQNASVAVDLVTSRQDILSSLFNSNIKGNSAANPISTFRKKGIDENQLVAANSLDQNSSNSYQMPSGTTRLLAHGTDKNDVWVDFFVDKLKFLPTSNLATIYNSNFGCIVGYDRFFPSEMITGAVGYNYSTITDAKHIGHGHQNQIFGIFQGRAFFPDRLYLGYSLYGSVNLNDFRRSVDTGSSKSVAKSHFTSYTLDPHLNFGYDWCVNDWLIVEPFLSNDFFFHFEPSYSEKGVPGYNQYQSSLNSGLYVMEPGVNLYQRIQGNWGLFVLQQELGYKWAQPMFGTTNEASIIGTQTDISTQTGLRNMNLFVFGLQLFARTHRGFYGDVLYRGEWGTGLISNALHLQIGQFF